MSGPSLHDLDEWRRTVKQGLAPFVEATMVRALGAGWRARETDLRSGQLDIQACLRLINQYWGPVFSVVMDRSLRAHLDILRNFRNLDAHQQPLSEDEFLRALDSGAVILRAVRADTSADVFIQRREQVLRARYASAPVETPVAPLSPPPMPVKAANTARHAAEPGKMTITAEQRQAYLANPENMAWKLWVDSQVVIDGVMDLERLYALAQRYGIQQRYDGLNPGQQRMNIGNRLRRIVPKEEWWTQAETGE